MHSLKRKEQHKVKDSVRTNTTKKNTSSSKGKKKAVVNLEGKKSSKGSNSAKKLIKAQNTALEQSTDKLDIDHITSIPMRNKSGDQEQSEKTEHQKLHSERDDVRNNDNKSTRFIEHCEESKFLKISKRSSNDKELIAIQLPKGLPSKLLLKALLQEQQTFDVLREQVIELDHADDTSIDVQLESINTEHIATLVKELDELVGQFTARN